MPLLKTKPATTTPPTTLMDDEKYRTISANLQRLKNRREVLIREERELSADPDHARQTTVGERLLQRAAALVTGDDGATVATANRAPRLAEISAECQTLEAAVNMQQRILGQHQQRVGAVIEQNERGELDQLAADVIA